ncbi:hypothetical protein TNCV_3923821 [Trichonephila clavipes]|nr:hypothetical protein TNCV_3923821 [Trichonephila clavipes]
MPPARRSQIEARIRARIFTPVISFEHHAEATLGVLTTEPCNFVPQFGQLTMTAERKPYPPYSTPHQSENFEPQQIFYASSLPHNGSSMAARLEFTTATPS